MKKVFLFLICIMHTLFAFATNYCDISGTVTSMTDNEPLIGATVAIKGTTTAAISDMDGNFSLKVPVGSVITVTYVGYEPYEATINKSASDMKVQLRDAENLLNELVVTALGIKREEKALGYSVQKVDSESLQRVPGVDVATSLTGKISGLLVKNSSDFASEPSMTIRGEEPLIVIDGVPYANMTMRDISANDIESMSVLKGATASALYGSRGASGAIMITTKNGNSNKKPITVSLSTNTMFSAGFIAIPEKQALYGRGTNNSYDKNAGNCWGTAMDGRILEQWDPYLKAYREYEYLPVGKDNFKNFIEDTYVTNNNLSVAYKGSNSSLRTSFNWTETKGLYPNSTYDKFAFSIAGNMKYKKFSLAANASYHKQQSDNIGFNGYKSYDPMYTLLIWTAADYNVLDYKDYWNVPGVSQNFTYQSTHNNPYYDRNTRVKGLDRNIFNTSLEAKYQIIPGLDVALRSGLDFYNLNEDVKMAMGSYVSSGDTGACGAGTWNGKDTGLYAIGKANGFSINNDFVINGQTNFLEDFQLNGLLGGTIFYKRDDKLGASTQNGLSVPEYYSLNASVDPVSVESSTKRQQVNSIYGRLALSWRNLVYAEGTLRNDWSSTLSKETQSYLYPSISGSVVLSEFFTPTMKDWVEFWKVRGSWTVSKTPPGVYAINNPYSVEDMWGILSGAQLSTSLPQNSNVKPETSSTFEIGTQFYAFNNKVMVDVTYYNKLMYNFLVKGKVSEASGYANTYVNSKEQISRRGWEITVSATPIETTDWKWDIVANWSKYARYYKKLDDQYSTKKPWVKVGNRVDAYTLKDYALDSEGNHVYNNGRIQFNPYTSVYGYSDPDWIWGLSTNLSYKDFTLGLSLDGRVGGLTNSITESYLWSSGSHPDSLTPERALDVANPGSKNFIGQGVKVISGKVTYDNDGNVLSDTRVFAPNDVATTYKQYITDMHSGIAWGGTGRPADCYSTTFLKLREVSLYYNVPAKYTGPIKSLKIGVVGQNLLMWAKDFRFSDPDGGTDNFNDPSIRYIGFNINVSF